MILIIKNWDCEFDAMDIDTNWRNTGHDYNHAEAHTVNQN